jgi:2-polyprenyl-3-methyl-5-hydroxy-6-metoxy-1,4-benzoquinol methylase
MAILGSVRQRRRQPELMDQPDMEGAPHAAALRGLERINAWSGSARILWPSLKALAESIRDRPARVLDVAMGAGDLPIRLWHKARRAGYNIRVDGCDISASAVAYARSRAAAQAADVHFFEWNALIGDLPEGYDAAVNSLFLHHLDEPAAVAFLRRLARAAGRLVLVNDLERGLSGWLLAYLGTRLLSRSPIVHYDGLRSVEGAFTLAEARHLADEANLDGATVARRWPCRFLLTWSRA